MITELEAIARHFAICLQEENITNEGQMRKANNCTCEDYKKEKTRSKTRRSRKHKKRANRL
jgi:hypothetical protein